MTDPTPVLHEDDLTTIHVDEFLSHAPERVWAALTEPELMREWLMDTDFRPELGHRFTFQAPPNPKTGFSGQIACEVLAVEPLRRLQISWNDADNPLSADWTITWTLVPEGRGTRLFLEHAGFDPDDPRQQEARTIMRGGWRAGTLRRLTALLARTARTVAPRPHI